MNDDVKGKSKIVMFGKKALIKGDEVAANSRLEKAETSDLLARVMVGLVLCPFVQDMVKNKSDVAGKKEQVQQTEVGEVEKKVQGKAPIEDYWYPSRTMVVGVPLWTNWFLYSSFYQFLVGFQKAGVDVPPWDMKIFQGGEYGAGAPSVPPNSNEL